MTKKRVTRKSKTLVSDATEKVETPSELVSVAKKVTTRKKKSDSKASADAAETEATPKVTRSRKKVMKPSTEPENQLTAADAVTVSIADLQNLTTIENGGGAAGTEGSTIDPTLGHIPAEVMPYNKDSIYRVLKERFGEPSNLSSFSCTWFGSITDALGCDSAWFLMLDSLRFWCKPLWPLKIKAGNNHIQGNGRGCQWIQLPRKQPQSLWCFCMWYTFKYQMYQSTTQYHEGEPHRRWACTIAVFREGSQHLDDKTSWSIVNEWVIHVFVGFNDFRGLQLEAIQAVLQGNTSVYHVLIEHWYCLLWIRLGIQMPKLSYLWSGCGTSVCAFDLCKTLLLQISCTALKCHVSYSSKD